MQEGWLICSVLLHKDVVVYLRNHSGALVKHMDGCHVCLAAVEFFHSLFSSGQEASSGFGPLSRGVPQKDFRP